MLLGFPVEDAVSRKQEIHLLERTLVGFGIKGPYDADGQNVDAAEDVKGLFVELVEDGGKEESLRVEKVSLDMAEALILQRETVRGHHVLQGKEANENVPSIHCRWTSQRHPTHFLSHELAVEISLLDTAMVQ